MKKLILLACLFVSPLHAALFEDTDARKKLQEMQLKETELEARIVNLEAVIKSGSLNDMLNQIELIGSLFPLVYLQINQCNLNKGFQKKYN